MSEALTEICNRYCAIRREIAALEETLATAPLSERDATEFDKAVTTMKVGAKLIKRRLRAARLVTRGWRA